MSMEKAWTDWWNHLGHVARSNRDCGRYREAFEAGYLAALEDRDSKGGQAVAGDAAAVSPSLRLRAGGG